MKTKNDMKTHAKRQRIRNAEQARLTRVDAVSAKTNTRIAKKRETPPNSDDASLRVFIESGDSLTRIYERVCPSFNGLQFVSFSDMMSSEMLLLLLAFAAHENDGSRCV